MLILATMALASCSSVRPDPPLDTAATVAARVRLVAHLRGEGITDPAVLRALEHVPRHAFVRPEDAASAYIDEALPIAGGQTISQPYIVGLMTQLLELRGDERVLEIGTGSGYQAAVLAELAREVFTIEIDPALAESARLRLQACGCTNVTVRAGDGFYGWEEAAPFDAMIITAVAPRVPERLITQLKLGGRLVMPLGGDEEQHLVRATKREDGLTFETITDVAFVPMTGAVRAPAP